MILRQARAEDARFIAAIDSQWSQERWAKEIAEDRVWVACSGTEVVGALCRWRLAGEHELHRLTVDSEHRRRGFGRALLRDALRREPGPWLLEVASRNRAARSLYEGLGFVAVGRRAGYYRDGDDAILMRREP